MTVVKPVKLNYAYILQQSSHVISYDSVYFLKCIQNSDDNEQLNFSLTAVNTLNKLTVVWAKLKCSLSSLF